MDRRGRSPNSRRNLVKPVAPLAAGEVSQVLRIRGPRLAVAWFASLTPEQRGQIAQAAYQRQDGNA